MEGLEIGREIDAMDVGSADFDPMNELPTPPQDNNQVAAWYDTDL